MAELLPQLAGAGGLSLFAMVILYLLGSNRSDRKAAGDLVDAANRRANEAEDRARTLRTELDDALGAKRAAENDAARLARDLDNLRADTPDNPLRPTAGGVP